MIEAVEMAGFLAAHAIWCVSDGETLVPILGYFRDEERHMERLLNDRLEEWVEMGKNRLGLNTMNADYAALLYDSYITLGNVRFDAIMIEIRAYAFPGAKVMLAVPYTPLSEGGFKVHRPKIITWQECEDFNLGDTFEGFFKGVHEHAEGAKIWDSCIDESK
jgi:hypothetical protein